MSLDLKLDPNKISETSSANLTHMPCENSKTKEYHSLAACSPTASVNRQGPRSTAFLFVLVEIKEWPTVRQVKRKVSYRVDNFRENVGHRGRGESSCHGGLGTIDFTITCSTCRRDQSFLTQNGYHFIQNTECSSRVLFYTIVKLIPKGGHKLRRSEKEIRT